MNMFAPLRTVLMTQTDALFRLVISGDGDGWRLIKTGTQHTHASYTANLHHVHHIHMAGWDAALYPTTLYIINPNERKKKNRLY